MTIGVRYWHIDTRIASRSCGLTGKWLGSINVRLLRPAPTDRPTRAHTQRHMCPQTSFKEACIYAATMHDPDQSQCNRSVRRPRTRPPGDRHQMLDVGWSRAEEQIIGHRSRRSATCDTEGGLVLGNRLRPRLKNQVWAERTEKPFKVETYWSNERCFSEKIFILGARFVNCFLFSDFRELIFNRFGSIFKNRWKFYVMNRM